MTPSVRSAIPIIVTIIPVILFIQSIVTSLKFFLKRLKVHEKKNQYRADPPLTANKIGATLKSCGSSCIPKNANNAKMTKIAPGLEIPMITAWKKSLREYDGVGSSFFIFRKGSLKAMLHPKRVTTIPPTTMMVTKNV